MAVSVEMAHSWARNNRRATNYEFGLFIDRVMDREKSSQVKLARLIGMDHSTISRIRSGERGTSFSTVNEMVQKWPLTEDEKVELFTMFHYIPPGYLIVKDEW